MGTSSLQSLTRAAIISCPPPLTMNGCYTTSPNIHFQELKKKDASMNNILRSTFSNCSAFGRSSASLTKQALRKLWKSSEYRSGSGNVGISEEGIKNIARIGCTSMWGGTPTAISYAVIPTLQMSAYRKDRLQNGSREDERARRVEGRGAFSS